MTGPAATPFTRHLDGLVESARAARDGAFNTLDAVNRQTRAASDALVREAHQLAAAVEPTADRSPEQEQHDARFDPEDDDSNYSETDYPDTWLR